MGQKNHYMSKDFFVLASDRPSSMLSLSSLNRVLLPETMRRTKSVMIQVTTLSVSFNAVEVYRRDQLI